MFTTKTCFLRPEIAVKPLENYSLKSRSKHHANLDIFDSSSMGFYIVYLFYSAYFNQKIRFHEVAGKWLVSSDYTCKYLCYVKMFIPYLKRHFQDKCYNDQWYEAIYVPHRAQWDHTVRSISYQMVYLKD